MSRKEKLLEKIMNNDKNIKFQDLKKALELVGFIHRNTTGSHFQFTHERLGSQFALTIAAHGKNPELRPMAVRKAQQAIQDAISIEGGHENGI